MQRILRVHAVLAAVALMLCARPAGSATEGEECRSLGFTGLQLCSDCDTMASYINDEELVSDCMRCCTRGKTVTAHKYASAILEGFLDRLSAFPHIEGFVKNSAGRYKPALKLRNRYGAAPRLVMTSADGTKEIVQIAGWKTEHVEEFLDDKLDLAAVSGEAEHLSSVDTEEGEDTEW